MFYGCTSLTSIEIPDSVTSIKSDAFHGCVSLNSLIVYDNNPNYYANGPILFSKDKSKLILSCNVSIVKYIIPNSVTSIGKMAFWNCTNLETITIGNSVKIIDEYAF